MSTLTARLRSMLAVAGFALLLSGGATAGAQRLRGTVVDSATGEPVAGVVVMLVDSAGASIARNLSDQKGLVLFPAFPGSRGVRALRIGYRPRTLPFPASSDAEASIILTMSPLPRMLEAVRTVVPTKCRDGKRTVEAYALLAQARDALLATIVSRETNSASMKLIGYRRSYRSTREDDDQLADQVVRVDPVDGRSRTYEAVKTPDTFMTSGFSGARPLLAGQVGAPELLAPDAETLMSEEFATTYCFDLETDRRRPAEVGLAFRRPDQAARFDIEGVMWVDTAARVLRDVEFEYVGDIAQTRPRSSGRLHFRAFPNGMVVIDSWQIAQIRRENVPSRGPMVRGRMTTTSPAPVASVVQWTTTLWTAGGSLAEARWPDGAFYSAGPTLGTARIEVRSEDGKALVPGVLVELGGSPYKARTDTAGVAHFENVFPARYPISVVDSLLLPYRIGNYPRGTIRIAAGSTTSESVQAAIAVDHVAQRCRRAKRLAGETYLFGRVVDKRYAPLRDAEVAVFRRDVEGKWAPVGPVQKTGADGLWFLCDAGVMPGDQVRAVATRFDQTVSGEARADARVTIVDLRVP